jgi:DNA-binding NarL/FixJ family response regulator
MLGSESGLELTRQVAQDKYPGWTKVILISTHSAEDFADLIAATPAIGFLPKSQLSAGAIEQLLAEADGSENR